MKKIIKIQRFAFLAVIAALATLCSCNEDEIYEKEQYKHVFSLASTEGDYNVFNDVVHLALPESKCYVTASMGGSNPTEQDTELKLILDKSLIDKYNSGNYGSNVSKYANMMPVSMFTIDSYTLKIPAGATDGRLLIKIRPEGLSPDSIYLIPLKVQSFSNYELHPQRNSILYRVMIKNKYATQESTTSYKMHALIGNDPANLAAINMNKPVHPLAKNKVRIIVGMEQWKTPVERAMIEDKTITLTVSEADSTVTIAPYKNIDVEQLDGDFEYPNIFRIVRDRTKTYKVFLIYYRYTLDNKTWYVKEEIRREFNPDHEKPEDLL